MYLLWHIVDGKQLLALPKDDASYVLLQLIVVLAPNEVLPTLNSKNDMDVNLRVVLAMICRSYGADRNLNTDNYKDFAPTEHVIVRAALLGTPIEG